MSKKINIKVKDLDKLEFEICTDALKGDYISLNEINEIDFTLLKEKLDNKQIAYFNEKLEQEKKNWENDFLINSKQINELKASNEELKVKLSKIVSDKDKEYNAQIIDLKYQLKNVQETKSIEIEKAKLLKENELKEQINKLQSELDNLKNSNKMEIDNIILKKDNEYKDKINDLQNSINLAEQKHKEEIENIKRNKNQNIKLLGEELENWIQTEYSNSLGLIDDCKLEKTTKAIENTKPDFLFEVLDSDGSSLGSVTIEAKTQYIDGGSPKKNSEHYNKLDLDRKKNNSEFSLLISELEPNDGFLIKKVVDPRYENMFVVRPSYFITFLSIVRLLFLKRKDIRKIEVDFKTKKEILDEFESMKNEILGNSVKNIESKVADILKLAEGIKTNATKIEQNANVIIEKHLITIKNKIDNFNINKINKKIEKTLEN